MKKLLIISHTEHYSNVDGSLVGWGPTITEINHLAPYFELIIHIGFYYDEKAPPSALPYTANNIKFVALPIQGGSTFSKKLLLFWKMPKTIRIIWKTLKQVDAFQLRTPTGIGVYLIPVLTIFTRKKGWFKYAGNWVQKKPPLGYRLQRWMLKNQSRIVTINGFWPEQPKQCLSFENPCLTLNERDFGKEIVAKKKYDVPFKLCFVGRLEDEKGVQRILDALKQIQQPNFIDSVHFIGDGEKRSSYEKQAESISLDIIFHGYLQREEVFEIYRKSHFMLLPSTASEGFPKVIAEAMNFGCIPIVSSVSSIGHYVTTENGFIVAPATAENMYKILMSLKDEENEILKSKAMHAYKRVAQFTFDHYNHRIINQILKIN